MLTASARNVQLLICVHLWLKILALRHSLQALRTGDDSWVRSDHIASRRSKAIKSDTELRKVHTEFHSAA
jgi:hypothetical protein